MTRNPPRLTPPELLELRAEVCAQLDQSGEHWAQTLPALSPLAWHVGHALFIEAYWLLDRALGRGKALEPYHALYFPESAPKAGRGARLPPRDEILEFCAEMASLSDIAWADLATRPRHGLSGGGYLRSFLCQHYAQHLEIMAMTLPQGAAANTAAPATKAAAPVNAPPAFTRVAARTLHLGRYGCDELANEIAPYDNELGAHTVEVAAFAAASQPVTVAQWAAFLHDDGMQQHTLWFEAGRQWKAAAAIHAPHQWAAQQAAPDAAVQGVSWFEATAFARWASRQWPGAAQQPPLRLPHEYEWMAAQAAGALQGVGQVWEWCANPLAPYPGFRPFPYPRYTLPWCDGAHYVLKGHSKHTRPPVRRPGFRNFYTADQRHPFCGVRLVRDAAHPDPSA